MPGIVPRVEWPRARSADSERADITEAFIAAAHAVTLPRWQRASG